MIHFMRNITFIVYMFSLLSISSGASATPNKNKQVNKDNYPAVAQLGPRPFYLVNDMPHGKLRQALQECSTRSKFKKTDFSIGHRGAPMQFPEHTKESYIAAATMGAGILECDVTFTKDKELVCRHSQCDLHSTTNILQTPLAQKCSIPFSPAIIDSDGKVVTPAQVRCCTSDITLEEFKSLRGKMDAFNPAATTVSEYLDATPKWRTDLYTQNATLLSHKESISLFKTLNVKMTPELKSPSVDMPFNGEYTQHQYAQQMINEYKQAGISADNVYPQSFNLDDILYWIKHEPDFAKQAVYLDGRYEDKSFDFRKPSSWNPDMQALSSLGVNIIAPPMWMLVDLDSENNIIPSIYADMAKHADLDIITWTLERSGPLAEGGGWYYQSIKPAINTDSNIFDLLHVLAQDVGVLGVFSDWPATTSYYANCFNLD